MSERVEPVAVVVIAHGSRAEGANAAHRAVCAQLSTALEVPVFAAFLELAEPAIADAVTAAAAGADRVLVLPHFLYPGRHVTEDIPAQVERGAAQASGGTVELLAPSGEGEPMVALLTTLLRAALRV